MDAITSLLDVFRVRGAVYFSKTLRAPWGMEVDERPGFWRFHLVLAGSSWISLSDTSKRAHLNAGEFAIVPRGKAHVLSDGEIGQVTSRHNIPGFDLALTPDLQDNLPQSDETHLLCGYFRFAQGTPLAFLDLLPSLIVMPDGGADGPGYFNELVGIIQHELRHHKTSSLVVLNRLTEIMFYYAVRCWFEKASMPEGTLAALGDAQLQRALNAIHVSPEKPWTVDELARIAGRSRTAFSNHFTATTGFTPIEYLSYWRIQMASRFLIESDLSLDEIASRVGYKDTNAFSRAFSRVMGIAPGAYRKFSRTEV